MKVYDKPEICVVSRLATSISADSLYEVALVSRNMNIDDLPGVSRPALLAASKNWKLVNQYVCLTCHSLT